MLLSVNPGSIRATTNDGQTLLSLAIGNATRSHPNYALIDALRQNINELGVHPHATSLNVYHGNELRSGTIHSEHHDGWQRHHEEVKESSPRSPGLRMSKRRKIRKVTAKATVSGMDSDDPVNLLLHFSRGEKIKHIEQV
jgi:hypothetical protein